MKQRLISYAPLLLILTIVSAILLTGIHEPPLWDWDECIYAGYAKAMKQNGEYFINYWNGEPIFEKLPMYSILLQIPYQFAINGFTSRILTVLFALGVMSIVYIFAEKKFSKNVAVLSSLLLLVNEIFVRYIFRMNSDFGSLFFLLLGLAAWTKTEKNSSWAYISGIFFAIAVLIKGLSIFPFLLVMVLLVLIHFSWKRVINLVKIIAVFSGILFIVYAYEYLRFGYEFLYEYFHESHIRRVRYPIEFHNESILFYFQNLIKEFFPWILAPIIFSSVIIFRMLEAIKKRKLISWMRNNTLLALVLFILIPLVSITRTASKLAWYAIPIYPFFVVFTAVSIDRILNYLPKKKLIFFAVTLIVAVEGIFLLYKEVHVIPNIQTYYRQETYQESSKYPENTLDYLVPYGERQAKAILTLPYYTTFTWRYGGSPCAVFYTGKKVNYYYSVDDFSQRLNSDSRGLFLIENGDLNLIADKKIDILYNNLEYTLFRLR